MENSISPTYQFYPFVLLRTPAFPMKRYPASLSNALNLQAFRAALYTASKSLYAAAEQAGFEFDRLPSKARHAIHKYFNRICHRPTPFGLFAAVTACPWQDPLAPTVVATQAELSFCLNFRTAQQVQREHQDVGKPPVLHPNRSFYQVGKQSRYLYAARLENGTSEFKVGGLAMNEFIRDVLAYCEPGQSRAQLCDWLRERFGVEVAKAEGLVSDLVGKGLLIAEDQPITGPRAALPIEEQRLLNLQHSPTLGEAVGEWARVQDIRKGIDDKASTDANAAQHLYIYSEREHLSGGPARSLQQPLLRVLTAIQRLQPDAEPDTPLARFREAFVEKYERRCLPLLEPLDPELGLPYGPARTIGTPRLLKDLPPQPKKSRHPELKWTKAHSLLAGAMAAGISRPGEPGTIQLRTEAILTATEANQRALPNSMSCLFRQNGEQLILENAGGATATALAGRFSPFNAQAWQTCERLAQIEQDSNPDVVFAEVVFYNDPHTANVERRLSFYKHQIVLRGQGDPTVESIYPQDLWIGVQGKRLILWSAKLRKRVIPRLSSAYNYGREVMPLYRFLCDLQHQELQTNLNFSLTAFFPDLSFYPRVEIDGVIVQPAIWHLTVAQKLQINQAGSLEQKAEALKVLAESLKWPPCVAYSEGDHSLVIDTRNLQDLALLAAELGSGGRGRIAECLSGPTGIIDQNGEEYAGQFVAALFHRQKVYDAVPFPEDADHGVQRHFVPGSEWLYTKIYLHPATANEVLLQLLPSLQEFQNSGAIAGWFFLRYYDPEPHLRIRIKAEGANHWHLVERWSNTLEGYVSTGRIRGYRFDTYERELERYPGGIIGQVESAFCTSSALVAQYLARFGKEELRVIALALASLKLFLSQFGIVDESAEMFCRSQYEQFSRHWGEASQQSPVLNRLNQQLQAEGIVFKPVAELLDGMEGPLTLLSDTHTKLVTRTGHWTVECRDQLVADLIHLHLNRLFSDQQPRQEMVIYYLAWRHLAALNGRRKASHLLGRKGAISSAAD